jgi:hypothetical protein
MCIDTVVLELSSACYAIRTVKPLLSQESLKMVYCSYFHSIMTYGLEFWGNLWHSNIIFRLQKKVVRIIMRIRDRESCRKYFRELKMLPLKSQYIYSLLLFVINNRHYFVVNSEIHNINTRSKLDLHHPSTHLAVFQKAIYYAGIKVFNNLSEAIKVQPIIQNNLNWNWKTSCILIHFIHWTSILTVRRIEPSYDSMYKIFTWYLYMSHQDVTSVRCRKVVHAVLLFLRFILDDYRMHSWWITHGAE